jgi:hypothetical protein
MPTTRQSRVAGTFATVKRIWRELQYAQRRSMELKTGVPVLKPHERPRVRGSVEELEMLFAYEESRPSGR